MEIMEYLNLEEYTEGDSALHKLDARIKVLCAIISIFCIVFLTHWFMPLIFFAVCFGLVIYTKASLKVYLKRLLIPVSLVAFIGLIMPFTYGTTIIARVPWLMIPIYSEGIYFGILVFTRCISSVSVLNLLILVTPITKVMDSLAWFRMPGVIVDTMMLMFRYVGILADESTRMYRAQVSRCGHTKTVGFCKKLTYFGNIAGSLMVRAFDRSVIVGNAMISRGYTGKYDLYTLEKKKLPKSDIFIGALLIATSVGIVLADTFALRSLTIFF